MSWWGKLAGGAFGFMLGGPLGVLLGLVFGHQFDKGFAQLQADEDVTETTQLAFFTATFAVMGRVAKSDGRVSELEIGHARKIMSQMSLDDAQEKAAMQLFSAGKADDFDLLGVLEQFRLECHRSRNLVQFFIEIQIMTAMADGELHSKERELLIEIAEKLHFASSKFDHLLRLAQGLGSAAASFEADADTLKCAYQVLGITPDHNDAEVKKSYRRLMNQHHPDKLVARGMPEEMLKLANTKSQEIRQAYDLVRKSRKRH